MAATGARSTSATSRSSRRPSSRAASRSQWPTFDGELPKDLWKGGLAISGLYDLRPLVDIDWLNVDLRLDAPTALKLSPAFLPPATRAPVMTSVGDDESSEF